MRNVFTDNLSSRLQQAGPRWCCDLAGVESPACAPKTNIEHDARRTRRRAYQEDNSGAPSMIAPKSPDGRKRVPAPQRAGFSRAMSPLSSLLCVRAVGRVKRRIYSASSGVCRLSKRTGGTQTRKKALAGPLGATWSGTICFPSTRQHAGPHSKNKGEFRERLTTTAAVPHRLACVRHLSSRTRCP